MQPHNLEEYKGLREELATLKECITTYVGFIAGGAAVAFWGLAARTTAGDAERMALAFAAVLLAVSSTLVLLLLSYKFRSHNRYAGYSKLLTHERFEIRFDEDIVAWEVCLDRLRDSDRDNSDVIDYCQTIGSVIGVPNLSGEFAKRSGPQPEVNRHPLINGIRLLIGRTREGSGSWHFPVYVVRVIGAINAILVILGLLLAMSGPTVLRWPRIVLPAGLLLLIVLWIKVARDLCRLMAGSDTVDAYCWKFVPIRHRFLSALDPNLRYRLVGVAGASGMPPEVAKG